jgi:hypothetical protein
MFILLWSTHIKDFKIRDVSLEVREELKIHKVGTLYKDATHQPANIHHSISLVYFVQLQFWIQEFQNGGAK